MQQIFKECTVCLEHLTPEDIEKNTKNKTIYYTICNKCIDRSIERIEEILQSND